MKIKLLLTIGLVSLMASSCLKNKDQFGWDADKGQVLTGIYDKATYGEIKPFVLNLAPSTETLGFLTIKTQAARSVQPKGDIQATIAIDNSLVTAYNAANGTSYVALPANAYSIASLTVAVPANVATDEREVVIPITINKTVLNLSNQYALGVKLTTVSDGMINELEKEVIATFLVKNPWDGIYSFVSGFVIRYTAPGVPANDALSGPLGPTLPDAKFVTTGATTCQLQGLQWSGGGGVGGVDPITITIDPATNLTTCSSGANATFANWAGQPNNYNPATKVFTLNMRWNPTSTTREYSVVFKYKGPR